MPGVLPELICSDLANSLRFHRLLGFEVGHQRARGSASPTCAVATRTALTYPGAVILA